MENAPRSTRAHHHELFLRFQTSHQQYRNNDHVGDDLRAFTRLQHAELAKTARWRTLASLNRLHPSRLQIAFMANRNVDLHRRRRTDDPAIETWASIDRQLQRLSVWVGI